MLPVVMLLLLAVLSYVFYIKYVTPPFAGDTMDYRPAEAVQFGASSSLSSSSCQSPSEFLSVDPMKAASIQSNLSTAQSAISYESSVSKSSGVTALSPSVQVSAPYTSFSSSDAESPASAVAQIEKQVKDIATASASQPIERDDGIENAALVLPTDALKTSDSSLPLMCAPISSTVATIVVESVGNDQSKTLDEASTTNSVPIHPPSSNASDTPRQKKSKKKKSKREKKSNAGGKKTKKKKHGSKSETPDSDGIEVQKKKKSRKQKSKRDKSTSPKENADR